MKTKHVYIHIPFCLSKCPYCDFFSIPVTDRCVHDKYTDYLLKEISNYDSVISDELDSLYFGGGTPSLLESEILSEIISRFGISSNTEITLEVNPATADLDKLLGFREAGVNRISVGSQSFISSDLKTLGRSHSTEDIYECFDNSRKAGFENISLDLIIGVPGQSAAAAVFNANEILKLDPEHVSAYILTYYDKTPFAKKLDCGTLVKLDDDTEMEFFDLTSEMLEKKGIIKYEISNFSKTGFKSRHNSNTWDFGNYLGFGASAHSFVNGIRWKNPGSVESWYYSVVNRCEGYKENPKNDIGTLKSEFIMLGLRKTEGMDIDLFNRYFDADFLKEFGSRIEPYLLNKSITVSDNFIKLDPGKFGIFNTVVSDIIF